MVFIVSERIIEPWEVERENERRDEKEIQNDRTTCRNTKEKTGRGYGVWAGASSIRRCIPIIIWGVYEEEILEREEGGWTNLPVDPPSKTTKEIIHDNIFTYFNLIFAILGLLLILVGAFRDLTFLPVIIWIHWSVSSRRSGQRMYWTRWRCCMLRRRR